jgi:hypothetical protein
MSPEMTWAREGTASLLPTVMTLPGSTRKPGRRLEDWEGLPSRTHSRGVIQGQRFGSDLVTEVPAEVTVGPQLHFAPVEQR